MKEDNISQLGDYDAPFCEQHGSCYISLFKFKSFDEFNTPQTASNFRHLLSCGTIVMSTLQFGTQVKFRMSRDHNNRTAENALSAPWYYSEMELEPVAG